MFMGCDLERIERVDVLGQPVDHRFLLSLERAKQAIPDDQDAAVISIEILAIGTVVDPVM